MSPVLPENSVASSGRIAMSWAMMIATIAVLASRRTTTLTTPYLWAEDGLDFVPQFVHRGWLSLFDPISGYMAVIPRIISYAALTLKPEAYPLVSTAMSWIFMGAILAIIALSPIKLRAKPWLAIAALFVPTDPEVFGTALYTFWWAGLILMLLAVWEPTPRTFWLRLATAALCGVSTPLTILVAPLMVLRAAILRTRHDAAMALMVAACAALQMRQITASNTDTIATPIAWKSLVTILDKFMGRFAWGMDSPTPDQQMWLAVLGLAVGFTALYALWTLKDRWVAFSLLYLLGGSIALSIARTSVEIMGPTGGGPRYFFYPYVLLSWILIQGLASGPRLARPLFGLILALALINAATSGWSHQVDRMSWRRHVLSCTHFDTYGMPIYIHGSRFQVFRGTYGREVCSYLAAEMPPLDASQLYPFTNLFVGYATGARLVPRIVAQSVSGTSAPVPPPEGYAWISSFNGGSQTGALSMVLRRGDFLLFANGTGRTRGRYEIRTADGTLEGPLPTACVDPCTLAFTSDLLPDEFTVTFKDDGAAPDEWFAIGFPARPQESQPS